MRKLLSSPSRTLVVALAIVAVVMVAALLGFGAAPQVSAHRGAVSEGTQSTSAWNTPTTTPANTPATTPATSPLMPGSADSILAQAALATATLSNGSGDVTITANVTADQSTMPSATQAFFNQPITLTGTYEFNADPFAFDSMLSLAIAGQTVPLDIRAIDDQVWLQALGQWYDLSAGLGSGGMGMSLSQSDIADMALALVNSGVDASRWLDNLTVVGQENVNGADSYHLSATLDVDQMLSDIMAATQAAGSQSLTPSTGQGMMDPGTGMMGGITTSDLAEAQAAIQAWLQNLSVDMWVATDTYQFRQFQVNANVMPPAGEGGGISSVMVQATVTLNPATAPVSIQPPTNVRPFSDLQQSLNTLLGLFSGGAGSTGTTLGQ